MPGEKKKVICLECETEFELENGKGSCPKCSLNMGAILERDRHLTALEKLRKSRREKETPESNDPFGW